MQPIAHISSDFSSKFAIPRQSGLVPQLRSRVTFTEGFNRDEAVRGLDGFSHIWLIWQFSEASWTPGRLTVRPPRLGGDERMGVFATRSPFRPNGLGLSSVELLDVEHTQRGPVLLIAGADLLDGTPILDIKPYVAADLHPDARLGFTDRHCDYRLEVILPDELAACVPDDKREALVGILAQDPRPAYHNDDQRVYGCEFAGFNVRFQVCETTLTVVAVAPLDQSTPGDHR